MHDGSGPQKPLAVFCANVIHIAPWRVAEGLFAGAGRYLSDDGRLFLYGPFKRGGKHTAISNAVFDTSLRQQDPQWGVRDVEAVHQPRHVGVDLGVGAPRDRVVPLRHIDFEFIDDGARPSAHDQHPIG